MEYLTEIHWDDVDSSMQAVLQHYRAICSEGEVTLFAMRWVWEYQTELVDLYDEYTELAHEARGLARNNGNAGLVQQSQGIHAKEILRAALRIQSGIFLRRLWNQAIVRHFRLEY